MGKVAPGSGLVPVSGRWWGLGSFSPPGGLAFRNGKAFAGMSSFCFIRLAVLGNTSCGASGYPIMWGYCSDFSHPLGSYPPSHLWPRPSGKLLGFLLLGIILREGVEHKDVDEPLGINLWEQFSRMKKPPDGSQENLWVSLACKRQSRTNRKHKN